MVNRRCKLQIKIDLISSLSKEPINTTELMRINNLPFIRLHYYLDNMIKLNLVSCKVFYKKNAKRQVRLLGYCLTKKGLSDREDLLYCLNKLGSW